MTLSGTVLLLVHDMDGRSRTSVAGKGLVDRWLKASDVFHWHVFTVSRLQVLVQNGKNFIVEDLEFSDSVHHLLKWLKERKRLL